MGEIFQLGRPVSSPVPVSVPSQIDLGEQLDPSVIQLFTAADNLKAMLDELSQALNAIERFADLLVDGDARHTLRGQIRDKREALASAAQVLNSEAYRCLHLYGRLLSLK